MGINWDGANGLFTRIRTIDDLLNGVHLAQNTTVPNLYDLVLAQYTPSENQQLQPASDAQDTWMQETAFATALRTLSENEVIAQVLAHDPVQARSLTAALNEVFSQMILDSQTVQANTVTVTPTQSSTSEPQIAVSAIGTAGLVLEQIIAETLNGRLSGSSISLSTGTAVSNRLRSDYPTSSGSGTSLSIRTASSSMLSNAGFDNESTVLANFPAEWTLVTGTAGTDYQLTPYEIQTVIISGTPTSGNYTLTFTNKNLEIQQTTALAYNASSNAVAAALNALEGLSVTVVQSGTTPNFTHTITFVDPVPAGDQTLLSSQNTFDTGSIAHAETQAGSDNTHKGRSLLLIGDGIVLQDMEQQMALSPNTVYALSFKHKAGAATTGTLAFSLRDGERKIITSDAGGNNEITLDVSTSSTTEYGMVTGFFQTPNALGNLVYFDIRAQVALAAAANVYLDDVILIQAQQFYQDGPYAAAFEHLVAGNAQSFWQISVANNYAGKLQTWWGRLFQRQLPSVLTSPNIPDVAP